MKKLRFCYDNTVPRYINLQDFDERTNCTKPRTRTESIEPTRSARTRPASIHCDNSPSAATPCHPRSMTDEIDHVTKDDLANLLRQHIRRGDSLCCPFSCAGLAALQRQDKKTYDEIRDYFGWPTFTERCQPSDGKARCKGAGRKNMPALLAHVAAKAKRASAKPPPGPLRPSGPPIDEDDDDDDKDFDMIEEDRNDAAHLVYQELLVEWRQTASLLAFAMGTHARLGEGYASRDGPCAVRLVSKNEDVLRQIAAHVRANDFF